MPSDFDSRLEDFLERKRNIELLEKKLGHNSGMVEYLLKQLEFVANGEEEEVREKYYPGWTHDALKYLLRLLRNSDTNHRLS